MKYFVIGDEDTVLGFKYAGVEGTVVKNADEARDAFAKAVKSAGVGIIIINDAIAESIRRDVNKVRFEAKEPIVVEIPGPTGPAMERMSLTMMIQQAVGIRL
jgi:V/A-type H+-transporting ATPase subunit F